MTDAEKAAAADAARHAIDPAKVPAHRHVQHPRGAAPSSIVNTCPFSNLPPKAEESAVEEALPGDQPQPETKPWA